MSRKFSTLALAASLAFAAIVPAGATQAHAKSKNAKIAAGVVLGLAAVAALASASRSSHAYSYTGYRPPSGSDAFWNRCARWNTQCSYGNSSACIKYETRGCIE